MSNIIVYHGGTETVENPICKFGRTGVANDHVVDTVNLYIAGLMDLSTALRELSKHQPNNQICILSQDLINKYLQYDGTEEL